MYNIYKTFILALLLFYTEGGFAQARFKATALVGVNFNQIDGDHQEGYHKRGVSLGLDGSIYLNPQTDISVELLYNSKGSKPNPNAISSQSATLNTFSLRYSEIGLLLNHHYRPNSLKTYYMQSLFAGVSYGRLVQSSTSIISKNQPLTDFENNLSKQFNPHDFSFIVGWSLLFTPRIGTSFRFTRSMNYLYTNPSFKFSLNQIEFQHLKPYFLSLHGFYNLVSPNKTMGLKSKKQKEKENPLEELY